jgi:hypothetical protein
LVASRGCNEVRSLAKSENCDKLKDDKSLIVERGNVKLLLQECSLLVACLQW